MAGNGGRQLIAWRLEEEKKERQRKARMAEEREKAEAYTQFLKETHAFSVAHKEADFARQRAEADAKAAAASERAEKERARLLAIRYAPPPMEGLPPLTEIERTEYIERIPDPAMRTAEELRLRLLSGEDAERRAKQPSLASIGGIDVVRYGPDGSRLFGETPPAIASAGAGSAAPVSAPLIADLQKELEISFEAAAALVEIYKNFRVPSIYSGIIQFISTHLTDKIARVEESQRSKYTNKEWLKTYIDMLSAQESRELGDTWRSPTYVPKPGTFQYRFLVTIIKELNSEIERRATSGGAGAPPKPTIKTSYKGSLNLGGGYRKSKRSKSRSHKRSKSQKRFKRQRH
jgi:hypothetical protein